MTEPIVLSKFTLEEIIELGAQNWTVKARLYDNSAVDECLQKIFQKINPDSVHNYEGLKNALEFSLSETIQNAIEHGNQRDESKDINIHLLLQEHRSGNALLYMVIRDEGEGFDIDSPIPKNIIFGNKGLCIVKSEMDLAYNFKDPAVYMAKLIRRNSASPVRIIKVDKPLTRERLDEHNYHGIIGYFPDGHDPNAPTAEIHAIDLHALADALYIAGGRLVPMENAKVNFDPWSISGNKNVIKPYASIILPAKALDSFLEDARIGCFKVPYRDGRDAEYATIHTNSLFHCVSGGKERIALSYGLSLKFLEKSEQIIDSYSRLEKQNLLSNRQNKSFYQNLERAMPDT